MRQRIFKVVVVVLVLPPCVLAPLLVLRLSLPLSFSFAGKLTQVNQLKAES